MGNESSGGRAHLLLLAGAGVALLVMFFVEPIAQDPAYHAFADRRGCCGVPNCADVVSNLPFLVVGILGLAWLGRMRGERAWWGTLFVGVGLTAFGSAYYHWDPTNETLLWDRLPMSISFMALFTIVIGERVSERLARGLFVPLIAAGIGSVLWWHFTEQAGEGDLRFYALVQYFPIVALPIMLLCIPTRVPGTRELWLAFVFYGAAKALEILDKPVYRLTGEVSGHTLKHLAAAVATFFLLRMMVRRAGVQEGASSGSLGGSEG